MTVYRNRRAINDVRRRYSPMAIKAAGTIRRFARSYLKRKRGTVRATKRARIGERVGKGTSKKIEISKGNQIDLESYTLTFTEMTRIPQMKDIQDINNRERLMTHFKGFRLCAEIYNITNNLLYFNMAVVSYRCKIDTRDESGDQLNEEWFRSISQNPLDPSKRGLDFVNTEMNGMEYHCRPLNSDNKTVHAHWKYRLGPRVENNSTQVRTNKSNMIFLEKYVKVNRQIRYADSTTETCQNPVFLVWWCSEAGDPLPVTKKNACKFAMRSLTFFGDPH